MTLQENDTVLIEKHLSVELVLWLCVKVMYYFSQPIKYKCELYGFDFRINGHYYW